VSEYEIAVIGIGGVAVLLIQQTIMSMLRPFFSDSRYFDLMNFPVAAFVLMFLPALNLLDWRLWGGMTLALGTLATVGAKKVADAKGKD
jgi:hypothetical protein